MANVMDCLVPISLFNKGQAIPMEAVIKELGFDVKEL